MDRATGTKRKLPLVSQEVKICFSDVQSVPLPLMSRHQLRHHLVRLGSFVFFASLWIDQTAVVFLHLMQSSNVKFLQCSEMRGRLLVLIGAGCVPNRAVATQNHEPHILAAGIFEQDRSEHGPVYEQIPSELQHRHQRVLPIESNDKVVLIHFPEGNVIIQL